MWPQPLKPSLQSAETTAHEFTDWLLQSVSAVTWWQQTVSHFPQTTQHGSPRWETDRCQAIMTFSASETMSAADFCSFSSVLCDSLSLSLSCSHTVFRVAEVLGAGAVQVCVEFNKAGVWWWWGDRPASNQTDSVSKHQKPRVHLADVSYAYTRGDTKLMQGQALLLAVCHLSRISRLGA